MIDRLSKLIATVCGLGYAPWAPGTWGSLAGTCAAWWIAPPTNTPLLECWPVAWRSFALLFPITLSLIGVAAADRVARSRGQPDPSVVVCDEFVGMLWSCWGWPRELGWWLASFTLFRIFDIVKPWPIRACERLPGGWGIMADDIAAGLLTNLCLWLFLWAALYLWPIH